MMMRLPSWRFSGAASSAPCGQQHAGGTKDAEGHTGPNGEIARLGPALHDRCDRRLDTGEVSVAAERGNTCHSGEEQVEAWHGVVRGTHSAHRRQGLSDIPALRPQ